MLSLFTRVQYFLSLVYDISYHQCMILLITSVWYFLSLVYDISYHQCMIFHVKEHPSYSGYEQCVTFDSFPTVLAELMFNLFTMGAIYILPLLAIVVSYALILILISRKARRHAGNNLSTFSGKQTTPSNWFTVGVMHLIGFLGYRLHTFCNSYKCLRSLFSLIWIYDQ